MYWADKLAEEIKEQYAKYFLNMQLYEYVLWKCY
ncbi:hypothetical protein BMS3Abin15_00248 [bacterium BMS3Abin15]|nr:hypothetical protein BMS3Abin15_00248 [bacterium BMS3Abin15]